jgi:hypothetical protein
MVAIVDRQRRTRFVRRQRVVTRALFDLKVSGVRNVVIGGLQSDVAVFGFAGALETPEKQASNNSYKQQNGNHTAHNAAHEGAAVRFRKSARAHSDRKVGASALRERCRAILCIKVR